jgi:hypothetical protein
MMYLTIGLAIALVAFGSQSALLTDRDSPFAVITFATASILLFTLPRIGGNSRIPHLVVLIFGLTTLIALLLGNILVILTGYTDVRRDPQRL